MKHQKPSQINREKLGIPSRANNIFNSEALIDPISNLSLLGSSGSGMDFVQTSSINRAPVLTDRNVILNAIAEDSPQPTGQVGTLVSSLIPFVNDPDPGALRGIAVTGVDATNGNWFFSINDGETWEPIISVSVEDALLLASGTNSRVYFQPSVDYNGSIPSALTFRAWDLTGVTANLNGQQADTSINGGDSPFSTFSDRASLSVTAVNDAPVNNFPNVVQSIDEDAVLIFTGENSISVSDKDAGTSSLQVTLTAENGTIVAKATSGVSIINNRTGNVVLTGNQTNLNTALDGLEFRPTANFNGNAKLTVRTSDQGRTGSGGVQTVSNDIAIEVRPVNDAPSFIKGANQTVAEDSGEKQIQNWATRISTGSPNETEQELEFIVIVPDASRSLFTEEGQPSITTDGTLIYTPAENANGIAQITVALSDREATSAPQTFTIRISAANDAPINVLPVAEGEKISINEDETLVFSRAGGNPLEISDIDAGTNNIQVTLNTPNGNLRLATTENITVRTNAPGSITLTGTGTNINNALDGLAFTPTRNFKGDTSLTIITNDQGASGSGGAQRDEDTIDISVAGINDIPTFNKGLDVTVDEDGGEKTFSNWATRISAGAGDEAEQVLTFNVTNDNTALFTKDGQPQISPEGTLSFTLAENVNGEAEVTVTLQDDGGVGNGGQNTSISQTFKINVRPVNDAPVNLVPTETLVINEDETFVFSTALDSGIVISDIDAEDGEIQVTLTTANGSLSLAEGSEFAGAAGNNTGNLVLTGSQEDINLALEGLQFTPTLNFNGATTIQVVTSDLGFTGSGGAKRVTSRINLTVNEVNDAPFFTKGNDIIVSEDGGLQTIRNWATKISAGAFDEFEQEVEFIVKNDNNELFTKEGQPSISPTGVLTFRARDNASGVANVTVILRDGGEIDNVSEEQTFTITVSSLNDQPINTVPKETLNINEDGTLIFGTNDTNRIQIADIDAGDNPVQVTITALNGNLGITNLGGNSGFTVEGKNTETLTLTGSITDINFALDGLTFTPAENFNGETTIQVSTSDEGFTGEGNISLADIDSFKVLVATVNDAPVFTIGEEIITIDEDAGLQTITNWVTEISPGAENESRQTLQFQVTNDNNELFAADGRPAIAPNGTLTFKTADNASGVAIVTVRLLDNGGTENGGIDSSLEQTFTIEVKAINDAPINNLPQTALNVLEDGELVFSEEKLISVQDIDGVQGDLSVSLTATNGVLRFGNTGAITITGENTEEATITGSLAEINIALATLTFKPNENYNGTATIAISTQDKEGNVGDTDTININVLAVNDVPSFTKGEDITVNAGAGAQTIENWAEFLPGPENELSQTILEYVISSNDNPELFSVAPTIDSTGKLTFTPSGRIDESTTATIGIRVRDNGGTTNNGVDTSVEQFLKITVNPLLVSVVPSDESISEGNSDTTNYEFTINLSAPSTEDVTVNYRTSDGTATVGDGDYTGITDGSVTIKAGETSGTVVVAVKGDTKFEGKQTFNLVITGATNALINEENNTAIGTIDNDDDQPVISFETTAINTREGNTGNTPVQVTLKLSNASDGEVKVNYGTVDGTAIAGTGTNGDYTAARGTVTFAPGELTKTFTVNVTGDTNRELNETFQINLSEAVLGTVDTQASTATVKIFNDELVYDTDFNRDGKADIYWRNYGSSPDRGRNAVWSMNGKEIQTADFVTPSVSETGWRIEQIADFNGDNNLDLLWRNYGTGVDRGRNAIWTLDNSGQVLKTEFITDAPGNEIVVTDLGWAPVATADFSGDGKVDIYWRNSRTGENALWTMDGFTRTNGAFLPNRAVGLEVAGVGDFNRDNVIDILWHNYNTGTNLIQILGATPLDTVIDEVPGGSWQIVGVADMNNDDSLDLVWRNYQTGENAIWFMNGIVVGEKEFFKPIRDTSWKIERLGDYNGDFKTDLLWRNYETGENAIWFMDGETVLDNQFILPVEDTGWEIA